MKGIKNIAFELTNEEYDMIVQFKNMHGRPTWREMMLDYVDIKTNEEKKVI